MTIQNQELRDFLRRLPLDLPYRDIAVTGPSGSGKSTLIKKDQHCILNVKPDYFGFSVSGATRDQRTNEVDGEDYNFFKTLEKFHSHIYLETNEYEGNSKLYGTLLSEAERINIRENKSMVLDLDINGGKRMKEIYKNRLLWVFLSVPIDQLLGRLQKRMLETGESEEQIKSRIITAEKEQQLVRDKILVPDLIIDYSNFVNTANVVDLILKNASYTQSLLKL
ncbi:MAG: hypothetical protein WCQ32_02430 [bacterium]